MTEERKRILRMLAEGTISVDEGEELLRALSDRKTERVEREVEAAKGKRSVWPYVILVVVALVALPTWGFGIGRMNWLFPAMLGPASIVGLAAIIFWIAMLINCIKRRQEDFRLLLTQNHEHEKWIWCAIVLFGNWVGALAYFIIIRQAAQSIAPPVARRVQDTEPAADAENEMQQAVSQAASQVKAEPEEPFTPSPPARSLWWFALWGILFAVLGVALSVPCFAMWPDIARAFGFHSHSFHGPLRMTWLTIAPVMIVFSLWISIFWVWMVIDCLARDYREFGTLVSTDKSLDKILWLLLILFTFVIGALAYHISVRRRPRPKASST